MPKIAIFRITRYESATGYSRRAALLTALSGLIARTAPSQVHREAVPAFDIASVKLAKPGARARLAIEPGGHLFAFGFSLKALTGFANHVTAAFQISGGDGWMSTDRWDIEAKAEDVTHIPAWAPPEIPEVIAVRLRALLEDRFALKTHTETRQIKAYALTMAKNGSKLAAAGPPEALVSGGQMPPANQLNPPPGSMIAGPGIIAGSSVTITQIVTHLNKIMDLPVIDETGLDGHYNFRLRFDPESVRPLSAAPPAGAQPAAQPSGEASIFEAIQVQLGLSLAPAKLPVAVVVIDSARKPTGN
jgi:uncharacterized protein (TIGR03435 family)